MIRRTSEGEQGHSGHARHAPAWPAALRVSGPVEGFGVGEHAAQPGLVTGRDVRRPTRTGSAAPAGRDQHASPGAWTRMRVRATRKTAPTAGRPQPVRRPPGLARGGSRPSRGPALSRCTAPQGRPARTATAAAGGPGHRAAPPGPAAGSGTRRCRSAGRRTAPRAEPSPRPRPSPCRGAKRLCQPLGTDPARPVRSRGSSRRPRRRRGPCQRPRRRPGSARRPRAATRTRPRPNRGRACTAAVPVPASWHRPGRERHRSRTRGAHCPGPPATRPTSRTAPAAWR